MLLEFKLCQTMKAIQKHSIAKKTASTGNLQIVKREIQSSSAKHSASTNPTVVPQNAEVINPLFHLIEPHLGVVHGPENLSTMKR